MRAAQKQFCFPIEVIGWCVLWVMLIWSPVAGGTTMAGTASAETEPRQIIERDFVAFLDAMAAEGSPRLGELGRLFDEYDLDELQQLVNEYGVDGARWALALLEPRGWGQVISRRGSDFFLVLLHSVLDAREPLVYLTEVFGLDAQRLTKSAIDEEGRFTGALSVLGSCVATAEFSAIVDMFARKLPKGVFIDAFYEDPYLVANALKVIRGYDPSGQWLERYLNLFPDTAARGALFSKDLPGLVVTFATIHDISEGKAMPEVFGFFDLTQPELAQLIARDALSTAYVFYGAHLLGGEDFQTLVDAVGKKSLRKALFSNTKWLASYLMGLQEISFLSTTPDILNLDRSLRAIEKDNPNLLRFPEPGDLVTAERTEPIIDFMVLEEDELLERPDKVQCIHEVLLGVLALFQGMLNEHAPDAALSEHQYRLLKLQILSSTRFSEPFDSASSNFELGAQMLRDRAVPMIPLVLAHELAHQVFTIQGFDAQGLSGFSIHELSADIGARAIAQLLDEKGVLGEALHLYEKRVVSRDDFARHNRIPEDQLIALGNEHIIGRTQLSYISEGFAVAEQAIDWERMFALTLHLLRTNDSMRFGDFVERLVFDYTYLAIRQEQPHVRAEQFSESISSAPRSNAQLIDMQRVRSLIELARQAASQ